MRKKLIGGLDTNKINISEINMKDKINATDKIINNFINNKTKGSDMIELLTSGKIKKQDIIEYQKKLYGQNYQNHLDFKIETE